MTNIETTPDPRDAMFRPSALSALALVTLLSAGAMAQQPPSGTGLDGGYGAGGPPPPPPGGFEGHHPQPDPFVGLPRPLTPEAVAKAMEEQFSRRPHVGRVTEKDPSTLMVEVVMPDGRSQFLLVDKQTGARQPLR
jgi:hypothetical protein